MVREMPGDERLGEDAVGWGGAVQSLTDLSDESLKCGAIRGVASVDVE
ncbi:hypothetical protein [Streptomyces fructofermentans]